MTFDEARAAHPTFGVTAYAYEPGGQVTLEVLTASGETFTFAGPTLQDALDRAFPPPPPAEPEPINAFD